MKINTPNIFSSEIFYVPKEPPAPRRKNIRFFPVIEDDIFQLDDFKIAPLAPRGNNIKFFPSDELDNDLSKGNNQLSSSNTNFFHSVYKIFIDLFR